MEVSGPSTTQRFGKPPDCTGSTLGACPSGTTRHGGRTHGGSATAALPRKSSAMRARSAWCPTGMWAERSADFVREATLINHLVDEVVPFVIASSSTDWLQR